MLKHTIIPVVGLMIAGLVNLFGNMQSSPQIERVTAENSNRLNTNLETLNFSLQRFVTDHEVEQLAIKNQIATLSSTLSTLPAVTSQQIEELEAVVQLMNSRLEAVEQSESSDQSLKVRANPFNDAEVRFVSQDGDASYDFDALVKDVTEMKKQWQAQQAADAAAEVDKPPTPEGVSTFAPAADVGESLVSNFEEAATAIQQLRQESKALKTQIELLKQQQVTLSSGSTAVKSGGSTGSIIYSSGVQTGGSTGSIIYPSYSPAASVTYLTSSTPWTWPGSQTEANLRSHLSAEHNINTAGMSFQAMQDLHSSIHNAELTAGRNRSVVRTTQRQAVNTVAQPFSDPNCPNDQCPQRGPAYSQSGYSTANSVSRSRSGVFRRFSLR